MTQAILGVAVLAVVYRRQERRAFWLGFALFGWGYMALTWESWWGSGADRPAMLTSMTLDHLEYYFQASAGPESGLWSLIGPGGGDPRSQLLAKLEEPVVMSFAYETPLEDVLKYIKQATTTATYPGIQIYVDPVALNEAGKTMTSTVWMNWKAYR